MAKSTSSTGNLPRKHIDITEKIVKSGIKHQSFMSGWLLPSVFVSAKYKWYDFEYNYLDINFKMSFQRKK